MGTVCKFSLGLQRLFGLHPAAQTMLLFCPLESVFGSLSELSTYQKGELETIRHASQYLHTTNSDITRNLIFHGRSMLGLKAFCAVRRFQLKMNQVSSSSAAPAELRITSRRHTGYAPLPLPLVFFARCLYAANNNALLQ